MNPQNSTPYFSLVVLCYRSGSAIIPIVEKLHHMFSYLNFPWEIILVGNYLEGSGDPTPDIVKSLEARLPNVKALTAAKKGMMGWDMRLGLDTAQGKYIGIIDGDGQFPLESIFSCFLKMESENLDFVKTYRVNREDGIYRKVISWTYNKIFRWLFKINVHDANSKPKILLRSKYELMKLQSDDWFADAEMMIRAGELGLKIGEIPIHFYSIEGRSSFVKPTAILEFLKNLLKYRFRKITLKESLLLPPIKKEKATRSSKNVLQ